MNFCLWMKIWLGTLSVNSYIYFKQLSWSDCDPLRCTMFVFSSRYESNQSSSAENGNVIDHFVGPPISSERPL